MASISARGSAAAALGYYDHLQCDDYYSRGGEPPGRQAGRGAERLSLTGPVTHTEFEASLQGLDPKTSEQLAQIGGRGREHSAGWDMTFSAPKSVSVLWALSDGPERAAIEQAHQSAGQTVRHGTPPLSESTKLASKSFLLVSGGPASILSVACNPRCCYFQMIKVLLRRRLEMADQSQRELENQIDGRRSIRLANWRG